MGINILLKVLQIQPIHEVEIDQEAKRHKGIDQCSRQNEV
jgi:hypothetical protein